MGGSNFICPTGPMACCAGPPSPHPRSTTPPEPLWQGSVGIAFDLMRINLVDLPRLPSLVPKLKLLFAEPEDAGVGDD